MEKKKERNNFGDLNLPDDRPSHLLYHTFGFSVTLGEMFRTSTRGHRFTSALPSRLENHWENKSMRIKRPSPSKSPNNRAE